MTPRPTDPERRRAIDDLLDGALDQPQNDRAAWLEANCDDPGLRREVEALLKAHDLNEGILEQDAAEAAAALLRQPPHERLIGPYRVLRELGRGGMGVVYLAERADGQYRRRVAVKLLRNSPDADELHRRFLAERQILASLNHPNIAQLLDGGVTDGQLPYLVMEYVDGVPITTYCDRRQLGVEARLGLFRDVCAAVHHAHQNLVIHRDIKPGNILVTGDGRVKLLDFGIAKLLNPALGPADQPMTRTAFRAMTPEYASPEQVRGESLTTASDVYALGVVLCQLLCGRRPYRVAGASAHELEQTIVHRQPDRPSVALSRPEPAAASDDPVSAVSAEAIALARGLSVERLKRRLRGDLDAIVMMALRKEPSRRYGSAEVLWEDLQRHLEGLPILADRGTSWYRARKFLGRHRLQASALALVTVSLAGGAAMAARQAAVASRERDRAERALSQSRQVSDFLVTLFRTAAPPGAARDEVKARDLLATGTTRVEELADQPAVQAQMLDALGRINEQLGKFDEAEQLLRRALALRRSTLGDDHLDVAASLNNLAIVVRQKGPEGEAVVLHREALEIQLAALGPRHPDVAQTLRYLAQATRDEARAESLIRAARDIQRAAYGAGHLAITGTNATLADLLASRGAYDSAESLLRENLAIRERLQGPDHPATAHSMTLLGNLLASHRQRPAEAESLYTRAVGILRHQPQQWLPHLVGVLSGLTGLAAKRGDYVQAEAYAREALEAQRRAWGPTHPYATETMGIVARQLASQGRYAEAEAMLREAISLLDQTFGPRHIRVGLMLIPLGRVHAAMGRPREAEADLRRALTITEVGSGRQSRWTGAIAALLAELVGRRGDSVEAGSLFERSAAVLRPLPPQVEEDIRAAYAALADYYRAANRPEEATYFRRRAEGR